MTAAAPGQGGDGALGRVWWCFAPGQRVGGGSQAAVRVGEAPGRRAWGQVWRFMAPGWPAAGGARAAARGGEAPGRRGDDLAPRQRGGSRSQAGFSLIEALVALVILAFAAVALIGAAEAHLARIGGVERRAMALWVAENHLAEIAVTGLPEGPVARRLLDRDWAVTTAVAPTGDPDLARVEVAVTLAGDPAPTLRLGGFVDLGAVR